MRSKQVDAYELKYTPNKLGNASVGIYTVQGPYLGAVYYTASEPCCESESWACLRVHVVNAAAEFLAECIEAEKREALSTFKCEVEYKFRRDSGECLCVLRDGFTIAVLNKTTNYHAAVPTSVIAAARKFAGWEK